MGVEFSYHDSCLVATLKGDLDIASVPRVRAEMEAALLQPGRKNLVLDLSGVTFMDSSGLGFLLGRYRLLSEQGGKVAVAGARAQVRRVLDLSGLAKIMPVTETVAEAVERLGRGK